MTQAMALADETWSSDAQDWLTAWAWSGMRFTSDDMRRAFRPAPHPNMVGKAFQTASRNSLIRAVGYTESSTPSRNRAVIRVWVGNTQGATE